jgi:hypothetical protein
MLANILTVPVTVPAWAYVITGVATLVLMVLLFGLLCVLRLGDDPRMDDPNLP